MMDTLLANRRRMLAGLALLAVAPSLAHGQEATELVADGASDQTLALQTALDRAAASGQSVRLPAGTIRTGSITLPGNLLVEGVPGRTVIAATSIQVSNASGLVLRDIGFAGPLSITGTEGVTLERCQFASAEIGVSITDSAVTISDCSFTDMVDAAIHSMDSRGLLISGNRITRCGNAGIRIWRSESGADGSIITGNRISAIDWRGGGNGQNGNGINVFKADDVIIADNHIADCAFTAVRLNTTNNAQVSGNICLNSGEVAIFSEFEFSGSVIANNIIDGAATGISITNLDVGGHLAVCSGNIVRNITPVSTVNPDTIPIGIFAEADTAITGNTISNIPGVGIAAGYGTFLRNVLISGNVVTESRFGIGVSVVEAAGSVTIGSNMVEAREHAIVGMAWQEVVETDLVVNAARYTNVRIDL